MTLTPTGSEVWLVAPGAHPQGETNRRARSPQQGANKSERYHRAENKKDHARNGDETEHTRHRDAAVTVQEGRGKPASGRHRGEERREYERSYGRRHVVTVDGGQAGPIVGRALR